jgi:carbonic anhydrase
MLAFAGRPPFVWFEGMHMFAPSRRGFLASAAVAGLGVVALGGCSRTADSRAADSSADVVHGRHGMTEETAGLTPDQALAKLVEGNKRFVEMQEVEPNLSATRLLTVAHGQHPFVGVLGCVDSRVPPELVFDRGLGDIFDARIAGAIADDAAIGSLEFGVEEFGVPLLVVLGHSSCGAVTSTVKALDSGDTTMPGRIGALVDPIIPAVQKIEAQGIGGAERINGGAREVVREGVRALRASPVLEERLTGGKLKVIGAFYNLDSGKVDFLDV